MAACWSRVGEWGWVTAVLCLPSVMSDSATPWAVAQKAPLSMGILQARVLEWVAMPSSGDLPNPRIKPSNSELIKLPSWL